MQQLRISPRFFRNERDQNYREWKLAFWRELFQNSIDARASQIDISLTEIDGGVHVTFADDGIGMSREVLENVYFAMGESTKGGSSDQIGGMGRARILTCFAMDSYHIRSHDWSVRGFGGDYEVTSEARWHSGCKLSIVVGDATLTQMRQALDSFRRLSRIEARLTINGEVVRNACPHSGRHVRDLQVEGNTFAKVFVNKSSSAKRMFVRVSGISMFDVYSNADVQIVVEIDPARSRDVLTANRDGLRGDYSDALYAFVAELSADKTSAVRTRAGQRTMVIRGSGMKTITRARRLPDSHRHSSPEYAGANHASPGLRDTSAGGTAVHREGDSLQFETVVDEHAWLTDVFGTIYIYDETENSAMRKTMPRYLPEAWKPTVVNGRTVRNGRNIIRVLLAWKIAVEYALEVGMEVLGKDDIQYGVGFVFDDQVRANCTRTDGGHVFCLRPMNTKGLLDFAITDRADLMRLMSLAKHEVTHVRETWHDEDFATMREDIDMVFDQAECFRRIKKALDESSF